MVKRKTNRAKRVDHGCRNHGSCKVCHGNRLHSTRKRREAMEAQWYQGPRRGKANFDD